MPATKIDPAALYAARFGEEKKDWNAIRVEFGVSYRSSQFLAELGEFVRADSELLAKHPEFAAIDGAAATDIENPAYVATRETIRAERTRGVGFRMLADRTGLSIAQIRKIVGESDVVGTTARIGYRARYGGRKVAESAETTDPGQDGPNDDPAADIAPTDAEIAEAVAPESTPEPAAPTAPKRRRRAKNAPTAPTAQNG